MRGIVDDIGLVPIAGMLSHRIVRKIMTDHWEVNSATSWSGEIIGMAETVGGPPQADNPRLENRTTSWFAPAMRQAVSRG
jgi:hypothetical protein